MEKQNGIDATISPWIEEAANYSARKLLSVMTVSALKQAAKVWPRRPDVRRKADWVDRIARGMENATCVHALFGLLPEEEWEKLCELLARRYLPAQSEDADDLYLCRMTGLVFLVKKDKQLIFIAPQEIHSAYQALSDEQKAIQERRRIISGRLDQYAKAAMALYGVIDLIELANLINAYEQLEGKYRLTIFDLKERLLLQLLYDGYYSHTYGQLVSYAFLDESGYIDDAKIRHLFRARAKKPQYVPPNAEAFLHYADPDHHKSIPQARALRKKLIAYGANVQIVDEIVREIYISIRSQGSMSEQFQIMEKSDLPMTMEQLKDIAELFTEFHNHTRLWSNFGHTPQEISRLIPPSERMPTHIQIGPNMRESLRSGEMDIVDLYQEISKMKFPNNLLRESYLEQLRELAAEMNIVLPAKASSGKVLPFTGNRTEDGKRIGRNDPCPCGSGKKHKNCCAKRKDEQ